MIIRFVYFLLMTCSLNFTYGQSIDTISNYELVRLVNNLTLLKSAKTDELLVKIFETPNLPGSAGFNSGESTSNIWIAVSEYGDPPDQSLFRFNDLFAPKVSLITNAGGEPILKIVHIKKGISENLNFKIGLSGIEVIE